MRTRFLFLILLIGAALAQDKPKPHPIDFTQTLVNLNGKPLHIADEKSDIMTLGDASVIALETMLEEDRNADGKVKFERDLLARKLYKNKAATLTAEEVALIKERIGKVFGPNVVGASWPLLDPNQPALSTPSHS